MRRKAYSDLTNPLPARRGPQWLTRLRAARTALKSREPRYAAMRSCASWLMYIYPVHGVNKSRAILRGTPSLASKGESLAIVALS